MSQSTTRSLSNHVDAEVPALSSSSPSSSSSRSSTFALSPSPSPSPALAAAAAAAGVVDQFHRPTAIELIFSRGDAEPRISNQMMHHEEEQLPAAAVLGNGSTRFSHEQVLHSALCDHPKEEKGWAKPLTNVVTGILTCWSKSRERSGAVQSVGSSFSEYGSGRPYPYTSRGNRAVAEAAAALLQQTRLQQDALVETQDARDMWEWQMEQQQALTSQEHALLERNSVEHYNHPLIVLPALIRNSSAGHRSSTATTLSAILGQLTRNTSIRSSISEQPSEQQQLGKDSGGTPSCTSCESPAPSDLLTQFSNVWHDPELISGMILLFESAMLRCTSEVNAFCRIYMQQMVLSGYSLIRTLMEMEPNTVFSRKVHASYALESRINGAFFRCFENDSFDESGFTQIFDPSARALARLQDYLRVKCVDPEEALRMQHPSYERGFHAFCANKSEEIMAMFSWSMGYRNAAERDRFMEAFLRAAKWVWLLHRLANATNPPMQIVRVGRGQEVDSVYVESVAVPPVGSCERCPVRAAPKVEFMIMPGFVAHRKVFRCKVYQHFMCKRQ